MPEDATSLLVLTVVAVIAVIGLSLSVASFATDQSMAGMTGGGGMMNGGGGATGSGTSPGAFEWAILILSTSFLVLAVGLVLMRGREARRDSTAPAVAVPSAAPAAAPSPSSVAPPAAQVPSPAPAAVPVPEPALVKLLDEDERRMYLEIRDHDGEVLQRDLVALGIFSKAKVTRVLDKLEAKGVVVREAHGMTNRVRLVNGPPR